MLCSKHMVFCHEFLCCQSDPHYIDQTEPGKQLGDWLLVGLQHIAWPGVQASMCCIVKQHYTGAFRAAGLSSDAFIELAC